MGENPPPSSCQYPGVVDHESPVVISGYADERGANKYDVSDDAHTAFDPQHDLRAKNAMAFCDAPHDAEAKKHTLAMLQHAKDVVLNPKTVLTGVAKIICCGIFACGVPLLFPLASPDAGYFENSVFFYIYNPWVGFVYTIGTFTRLSTLWYAEDGTKLVESPFDWSATGFKTVLLLIASVIGGNVVLMACALPWGESQSRSYFVVYGAPLFCSTLDFFFIPFLKRDKFKKCGIAMWKACILINVIGTLLGLPLFVVFITVTVRAYADHWALDLVAPCIQVALMSVITMGGEMIVTRGLRHLKLSVDYYEIGLDGVFSTILEFSKLMLLPYSALLGSEALFRTTAGMACSDLVGAILHFAAMRTEIKTCKNKWKLLTNNAVEACQAMESTQKISEDGSSDYVGVPQSAFRATIARQRFDNFLLGINKEHVRSGPNSPADVSKLTFNQLSSTPQVKLALRPILTRRVNEYFALLMCPGMFMTAMVLLHSIGNKRHYHLYECSNTSVFVRATLAGLTKFAISFSIVSVELVWMRHLGWAKVLYAIFGQAVSSRYYSIAFGMAFVGTVMTSCFFIKHDGVVIFNFFCHGRSLS